MPRLNSNFWNEENKTKLIKTIIKYAGYGTRVGCIREMLKAGHYKEHNVGSLEKIIKTIEDSGKLDKSLWKKITNEPQLGAQDEQLRKFVMKNKNPSIGQCCRELDRCEETILRIVANLNSSGFDFRFDEKNRTVVSDDKIKLPPINIKKLRGESIKFGLCSDFHIGSNMQSTGLINLSYDIFEKEGCQFIVNAGDTFDGRGLFRGQEMEQWASGADEQLSKALEIIPKTKIKQYILGGNHCGSFKKSINYNIVRAMCAMRDDFIYIGDVGASFKFKNKYLIEVLHPSGGVSYARSYKAQKVAEAIFSEAFSLARSNLEKSVELPIAILIGHYHVASFIPYMSSNIILAGTLQAQTEYLKAKALCPDIGVWVVELCFDSNNNFIKIKPEWFDLSGYWREEDY